MFESTPTSELAHQISFAVFRVARLIRNKKLKSELENSAVDLVKELSLEALGELDRLVALAESVGEMNKINSSVLRRELNNLYAVMSSELAKSAVQEEAVYFGDIFGQDSQNSANAEISKKKANSSRRKITNSNADERKAEIVEFIRQFPGDCRMKDLNSEFTDVSERTLRNDVNSLIEDGLVDRLGGKSGPSSYFVAIQKSEVSGGELPDQILLPETTNSEWN